MAVFNEPTKWQTSLVNSGDANVIPQSTPVGTGEASFDDGFPQITQIPIGAGGIAPDRKDFNGLFKILGDWIFFNQNGGVSTYSENFDYVAGRVVSYNDNIYKCIQTNGVSSTVVAPGSVSPLGSDYWVQIASLADFANFANTDLSNLSASGQALFTNKADKDLSNALAPVQDFKTNSIAWGQPDYSSAIAITLTLNTSVTYTAPSDGFIVYTLTSTGTNNNATITVNGTNVVYFKSISRDFGTTSSGIVPVHHDDVVTILGNGSNSSYLTRNYNYAEFVPCKGAN